MQPYNGISIAELAVIDPIAAYGRLMKLPVAPIVFNAVASFSTFSLQQLPAKVGLDAQVNKRTWIDNIDFDLALPNAFVGNIFFPQAMAALKQNPGISVRTTVLSGPRYVVSDSFTALENFVNIFDSNWTAGWMLSKYQTIQTEFMLTAAPFNDPNNTPPYTVTLTYNGWQFLDCSCDEIDCAWATQKLIEAGILSPFGGPCAPALCK